MKVACIQSDVIFGDPMANAARAIEHLEKLAEAGVELAVFPEAFLTGYCVASQESARSIAINRDHKALSLLDQACHRFRILAIIGFAELEHDKVFNTAVLLEDGRQPRFYRKTHLPWLGLDRFVDVGCELPVFNTRIGKIGVLICFDLRIPEAARTLALKGAELIVLPTNWPEGAETSAEHIVIARAAENRVFFAACNRVGNENGFTFIGRSKIISPSGRALSSAGGEEEVIVAEFDISEAKVKKNVMIPGEYETEVLACRQPALYRVIAEAMQDEPVGLNDRLQETSL